MKPHLLVNLFGCLLVGVVLVLNGCTTEIKECPDVVCQCSCGSDSSLIAQLEKDNYWLRQNMYRRKVDTVHVYDTVVVVTNSKGTQAQTRNGFPITAEYNARTDKWPVDTLKGKRRKEIANAHNKEWSELWHREIDETLFEPK